MRTKITNIALWLSLLPTALSAQQPKSIPIDRLGETLSVTPRHIVIKFYTSWCTYCKMQDHELSKHPGLVQLLEADFHYVTMDAETGEDILFNGKTYRFVSGGLSGGTHELAYLLGSQQGILSYPAWVLLDEKYRVIARHQGFLTAKQLRQFLSDQQRATRHPN